jgi:hypothetical protein
MDAPTRIGLGGTALFTLAGLAQPIVTWWVSGPIMAVCAGVAGWGFWPLIRDRIDQNQFLRPIPLHIAARFAYEAAEKADVLHLTTSDKSSADAKLDHFKILFIVDAETQVFGAKPPSTKIRLLPKEELIKEMHPADGDVSTLVYTWPRGPDLDDTAYINVSIRRRDMRRVIKNYIVEASRNK